MMKKISIFFAIIFVWVGFSIPCQGQLPDTANSIITPINNMSKPYLPLRSSLHIGSLIYNKGFSTFVMPELTTPVTKKISVSAGTMIMRTYSNSTLANDNNKHKSTGVTSNLFYTKGTYLYNERISFSGLVFYEQHLFNSSFNKNDRNLNLNGKGFAMDMNYKINSTSQFSIGVSSTSGYSPFGNGIFYQPMFYNGPFGW